VKTPAIRRGAVAVLGACATCAATAAPIYHSAGLYSYAQAVNWPPSAGGVEDTVRQGEGRFYPDPIGALPTAFSLATSALHTVDDAGVVRTVNVSASIVTAWTSQHAGSIDLSYAYETSNVVAGQSQPAGDGFNSQPSPHLAFSEKTAASPRC